MKRGHKCQRMLLHTMKGNKAVPCLKQKDVLRIFLCFCESNLHSNIVVSCETQEGVELDQDE